MPGEKPAISRKSEIYFACTRNVQVRCLACHAGRQSRGTGRKRLL
jgi:hypothetical protein